MTDKKQLNVFDEPLTPVRNTLDDGTVIIPFHDFTKDKIYKGMLIEDYHFDGGTDEDSWDAFVMRDKDGNENLVPTSHQISKALKEGYGHVFEITHKGKKDIKGGRTVNEYTISKSKGRDENVYQNALSKKNPKNKLPGEGKGGKKK